MNKKISSIIVSSALAFVMCFNAGAAELPYSIDSVSQHFGSGGYYENGRHRRGFIDDFDFLQNTVPGTEYFLPLRVVDFDWEREKGVSSPVEITPRMAEQLRLELKVDFNEGDEAFDRAALTTRDNEVGILLRFVESYPSVEELEFEASAYLTSGGGAIDGSEFVIRGTLRNRNRYVYATTKSVQIGVGRVATVGGMTDLSDVQFDVGCGVTIIGDILFGQTVYGAASDALTGSDEEIIRLHPQIVKAIRLETVDLTGKVMIDTGDDGVMHVYSRNLVYLGTTAGPLRFENTYYLAATRLE